MIDCIWDSSRFMGFNSTESRGFGRKVTKKTHRDQLQGMCGICAESSDCKESSGKCFCQKMTASRAYGLDQRSNTHDNRLSPTIKCGIEGVTLRSSGTSSSGYVVTTSRLNRYAHAHTRSMPFHHLHTGHMSAIPCQPHMDQHE